MGKRQRKITHFVDGIGIALDRLTPLARQQGALGHIAIFRHPELGKVFVLNDEIQHVEAWAPLYHEPLVHLPAAFVDEVKDVMILGGGTLYAASEVLKYKSVKRVVVFEHDPLVPQMAAKHYSHAGACLKDDRFKLFHEDAYSSVARFQNRFDLIINDGADLISVKSPNLFSAMARALKPTGVCADVIYRHLFEQQRIIHTIKHLQKSSRFALSLVFLPEYHGILHILSIWGRKSSAIAQSLNFPKNKEQLHWVKKPAISPCVYYDPRFLRYHLYLPRYLKIALATKKTTV